MTGNKESLTTDNDHEKVNMDLIDWVRQLAHATTKSQEKDSIKLLSHTAVFNVKH